MQKISLKIWVPVIVIFLFTVSLAVFLVWSKEEKISEIVATKETVPEIPVDWKTYRNEEYGFEVSYPENMYFDEGGPTYLPNVFYFGDEPREYIISLVIFDSSKGEEFPPPEWIKQVGVSEFIMGNERGLRYEYEREVPAGFERGVHYEAYVFKSVIVEVEYQKKVYRFSLNRGIEDQEFFRKFDQIIATFKVID